MGQIPIERGKGDAHAMDRAIEELRDGRCIGVFPEGTRSLGRELRARSGFGRLADAVPEAQIVCCTVEGTVDIPKFPKSRPHVRVRFFPPARRPAPPASRRPTSASACWPRSAPRADPPGGPQAEADPAAARGQARR